MRLEVVGNPILGMDGSQNIHINYNPGTHCTSVVCIADVVTVKIAIEVLQEKYENTVRDLLPEQIKEIEQAVKEAVNSGPYRNQNTQPRGY